MEQSAGWAAAEVAAWFPDSTRRGAHFATAFAAAWRGIGEPETVDALIEIAVETSLPAIVRASALETLLRYASPGIADRTAMLLQDEEALIRLAAMPLQLAAPSEARLQRIAPLLNDDLKAVRIEAARTILDLSVVRLPPQIVESVRPAMMEYQRSLLAKTDFPEAQMAIAGTALTLREFAAAESAFEEAVRLDPQLVDAWVMIARLRAAQGDGSGAEEVVRAGLRFNPKSVTLTEALRAIQGSEEAK